MNLWDVIRHLVEHGPFASDEDREAALSAVDEHEAVHGPQGQAPTEVPDHPFTTVTPVPDAAAVPEGDPAQ